MFRLSAGQDSRTIERIGALDGAGIELIGYGTPSNRGGAAFVSRNKRPPAACRQGPLWRLLVRQRGYGNLVPIQMSGIESLNLRP
jgi:hypothetical protein